MLRRMKYIFTNNSFHSSFPHKVTQSVVCHSIPLSQDAGLIVRKACSEKTFNPTHMLMVVMKDSENTFLAAIIPKT